MWMWFGNYGISALIVAIDRCFGGKKSKAEYIKEPILSQTLKNGGLTEEEIQKQRELFVAKLQVMKTNFELSKKDQVAKSMTESVRGDTQVSPCHLFILRKEVQ